MIFENVIGLIVYYVEVFIWWLGWGGLCWVDGDVGDLLMLCFDGVIC